MAHVTFSTEFLPDCFYTMPEAPTDPGFFFKSIVPVPSDSLNTFRCRCCSKRFPSYRKLQKHLITHDLMQSVLRDVVECCLTSVLPAVENDNQNAINAANVLFETNEVYIDKVSLKPDASMDDENVSQPGSNLQESQEESLWKDEFSVNEEDVFEPVQQENSLSAVLLETGTLISYDTIETSDSGLATNTDSQHVNIFEEISENQSELQFAVPKGAGGNVVDSEVKQAISHSRDKSVDINNNLQISNSKQGSKFDESMSNDAFNNFDESCESETRLSFVPKGASKIGKKKLGRKTKAFDRISNITSHVKKFSRVDREIALQNEEVPEVPLTNLRSKTKKLIAINSDTGSIGTRVSSTRRVSRSSIETANSDEGASSKKAVKFSDNISVESIRSISNAMVKSHLNTVSCFSDNCSLFTSEDEVEGEKISNHVVCVECKKQFTDYNTLVSHVINFHNGCIKCQFCEVPSTSRLMYQRHMFDNHSNDVDLSISNRSLDFLQFCRYCDAKIRGDSVTMVTHISGVHLFQHICEICFIGFNSKSTFNRHVSAHAR